MKYNEDEIMENVEELFLFSVEYFPQISRYDIATTICKVFDIDDENAIMRIGAQFIMKEKELLQKGYIIKKYYDDEKHKAYDMYFEITEKATEICIGEPLYSMQKDIADYAKNIIRINT